MTVPGAAKSQAPTPSAVVSSAKRIRCFVDPYADPSQDFPAYHVSLADAENRVNELGCCYWADSRTIQYFARTEQRDREALIAAGTFREAWKQLPSGNERILVWQMPASD